MVNELLELAIERIWLSQPDVEGRVMVKKALSGGLPAVYAERNSLLDTLIDVIRNAVEAMPEGGTLTVSSRGSLMGDKPCVEIAVIDTGVGVPAHDLSRVFDIFYSTKEKGLGFGLWRAKTLISSLGGVIVLESEVGRGSTLTIRIPVGQKGGSYGEQSNERRNRADS